MYRTKITKCITTAVSGCGHTAHTTVNIILTFTDQFGLFDFLTLLLDLVLLALVLLLHQRRGFHWLQ
ncbi:MAG: hypothetical protein IPJ90_23840 [Anaerolineaceae bacterium]|nr:hypothetical protein [Anaerolineaceae bacterium]